MKNLHFLWLLCIFLIASCVPPKFAARIGGNYATIAGDDTDNFDGKIGLNIGGYAEFNVADRFSVQPEVFYSQQGTKYSDSDGFDGKINLDYINVPVMGKFYVSDGFFLEAGPQIGFLVSAKDKFDSPISGEDDIKEFIKNTDFSGNVGAGYQFESGLNIGARFSYGFSNINDFEDTENFSNNNCLFSLLFGWRF